MATCDAAGEVVVSKNQDVLGSKQPTVLLKTEVCAVYIFFVYIHFTNINISPPWCVDDVIFFLYPCLMHKFMFQRKKKSSIQDDG